MPAHRRAISYPRAIQHFLALGTPRQVACSHFGSSLPWGSEIWQDFYRPFDATLPRDPNMQPFRFLLVNLVPLGMLAHLVLHEAIVSFFVDELFNSTLNTALVDFDFPLSCPQSKHKVSDP